MHPQRTNPDPGYLPVSDRMAGWIVGGFIVVCAAIVGGVLWGAMLLWPA